MRNRTGRWASRLALAIVGLAVVTGRAAAQCELCNVGDLRWTVGAPPGYGTPAWIAADGLGNVYLGVEQGGGLGYRASHDGGATWDAGDYVTFAGSSALRLMAAPDGPLVAAYAIGDEVFSRLSTDFGATWSAPVRAMTSGVFTLPRFDFEMVVESSGLVALQAGLHAPPVHASRAVVSSDFGRTWSPPSPVVYGDDARGAEQNLVVDDPIVAFVFTNHLQVLVCRTPDRGLTWDAAVVANTVPSMKEHAAIGASGNGHIQVAYFDDALNVRVAVSTDGGASFAADGVVARSSPETWTPFLLRVGEGEVAVLDWHDGLGAPGFSYSFSAGHGLPGTWTARSSFAVNGRQVHELDAMSGPPGTRRIVAVHDDYRNNTPTECPGTDLCESIFLQQTCAAPIAWTGPERRLDEDGSAVHSEDPVLFVDASGRVHAAWYEHGTAAGTFGQYVALDPASDIVPGALGNVLKAVRSGLDVELHWTDLAGPVGEYQVVSLDCDTDLDGICDQDPLDPLLGAAPYRSALPGAERRVFTGDVARPSYLVFYRVRATSACGGMPGPV